MSIASEALAEGFTALLESNGEGVTFRTLPVTVLINRFFPDEERGVKPNLVARRASEVEVRFIDIASIPRAGEVFEDSQGLFHRVTTTEERQETWLCKCEVSA
jgi:hypothetical protein